MTSPREQQLERIIGELVELIDGSHADDLVVHAKRALAPAGPQEPESPATQKLVDMLAAKLRRGPGPGAPGMPPEIWANGDDPDCGGQWWTTKRREDAPHLYVRADLARQAGRPPRPVGAADLDALAVRCAADLRSSEHRQPIDPKANYRTRDVAVFEDAARVIDALRAGLARHAGPPAPPDEAAAVERAAVVAWACFEEIDVESAADAWRIGAGLGHDPEAEKGAWRDTARRILAAATSPFTYPWEQPR